MFKKIFWLLVVVLLLLIVGLYWAIQAKQKTVKSVEAFVQAAQKDVPRFIDRNTWLENVLAEGKVIRFEYLVGNMDAKDEAEQAEELKQVFNLAMCESEYRKSLLEEGITVMFRYKNPQEELREFAFDISDC